MMDPTTILELADQAEYLRAQFITAKRPRRCNVVHDFEEEKIHVVADNDIWTMEIGSDDDRYLFIRLSDGEEFQFPLSMATC